MLFPQQLSSGLGSARVSLKSASKYANRPAQCRLVCEQDGEQDLAVEGSVPVNLPYRNSSSHSVWRDSGRRGQEELPGTALWKLPSG